MSSLSFARSELEAGFAGGVGQSLHPAVVKIATTIEDHFLDLGRLAALGDQLADGLGCILRTAALDRTLDVLVQARRRCQRTARRVVDDLGIDILVRAVDAQTGATIGPGLDRLANARLAPFSSLLTDGHVWRSLLLLAFLTCDVFADVTDTLALVRLWLAVGADIGGHLADLLLIRPTDGDIGLRRRRERDALGRDVDDFVAEAEAQLEVLALHRGTEADALDLQLLFEAVLDAVDHVGDQRACGAPGGASLLRI